MRVRLPPPHGTSWIGSRLNSAATLNRATSRERDRLNAGDIVIIGDDTLSCLLLAADVAINTGHVFDVSYASQRSPNGATDTPAFTIDPDAHALTSHVERLHLDLGAIGKGYALDRMAALLEEWEIPAACLQSGGSTALVLAPPIGHIGWSIGIGEGPTHQALILSNSALSGSGLAVKGQHLVDPRTGSPAKRSERAWALAPSAAVSDALSTAFFVWSDPEIAAFCEIHPEIGGAVATDDLRLEFYGALKTVSADRSPQ